MGCICLFQEAERKEKEMIAEMLFMSMVILGEPESEEPPVITAVDVYEETDFDTYMELDEEVVIEIIEFRKEAYDPSQPHLTKSGGVFRGPSGKETYYNLPMGNVIKYMRDLGYSVEEYPFWVREDGAKMLGDYVMVAANLNIRPKGTVVDTSLGKGLVVDTGGFAKNNVYQLDIATNW